LSPNWRIDYFPLKFTDDSAERGAAPVAPVPKSATGMIVSTCVDIGLRTAVLKTDVLISCLLLLIVVVILCVCTVTDFSSEDKAIECRRQILHGSSSASWAGRALQIFGHRQYIRKTVVNM